MSTTTAPLKAPLQLNLGCQITYSPNPPVQSVEEETGNAPTCPVPPIIKTQFKQVGATIQGSFSVSLNTPGTLTLSGTGVLVTAPNTIYLEIKYNGALRSDKVYKTTITAVITGAVGVRYTDVWIYLHNTQGEGTCTTPPFVFPHEPSSIPPSSGTTSAGTHTTVQQADDEDTEY